MDDKKDFTNEELVKLIQDGQTEYIPQLWDQVYKFICLQARRRLIVQEEHIKQLEDDMINESYFDFLQAVDGYKSDGGALFLTYLEYHIRNSFNRALDVRTQRGKNNPLRYAVSFNDPVKGAKGSKSVEGEESLTFQDIIIDHMAEEEYRLIENEEFWEDVHELLEKTILNATSGKMQEILLVMLHEGCIIAEACRMLGIEPRKSRSIYENYHIAMRHIRRHLRYKALEDCRKIGVDEYLSIGLRGSGVNSFRNNGFTSSTERAAVRLADREIWSRKLTEIFG